MQPDSGSPLRRAGYRIRQFTRGLRPTLTPHEVREARARLTDRELALFLGAEARDRRHAFDLFGELLEVDASEAELVAALLHDVGKGPLRAWHRVAFVLLNAVAPVLAQWLERERGTSWQRALWRLRHHARLGAERLEAAGSAPRVVALVRGHTGPPPENDPALTRFIAFDDRS